LSGRPSLKTSLLLAALAATGCRHPQHEKVLPEGANQPDTRADSASDASSPAVGSALLKYLPDHSGSFTAGALETMPGYVRRLYSHGRAKISATIAEPGKTPISYDDWVKMSAPSPAVTLDVPANLGAGFYDCSGNGTQELCNVHIHLKAGYHIELMGEGTAFKEDFDDLLRGLPLRELAKR
jgi:hypothetical protein